MKPCGRRCLTESLRQRSSWSATASVPVLSIGRDDARKGLSTEASVEEPVVDANALVQQQETRISDARSTVVSTDITTYAAQPPKSVYITPRTSSYRGPRRVSNIVMLLQTKMHELLSRGEHGKAVETFENFVNSGFKQAAEENLQPGHLPINKRPAEFQWLLYIHALHRKQRNPTAEISSAIRLMKQIGIPPKGVHYVPLLESIRRKGDKAAAVTTIDEMLRNGVLVTTICYEHAIFTCLMSRDIGTATLLLDRLFRSTSTLHTYRIYDKWKLYMRVIQFCASLKKIENALTFLRQMSDLQLLIPIHMYLDVAIHAAEVDDTAAADTMLSRVQETQQVFHLSRDKRVLLPVPVSEGILLAILNSAARTGAAFLAERVWIMLNTSLSIEHAKAEIRKKETMTSKEGGEIVVQETTKALSEKQPGASEEGVSVENVTESDLSEKDKADEDEHRAEQEDFVIYNAEASEDDWRTQLAPYLQSGRPLVESYHAFIEAQAKAGNIDNAFEMVLELEQAHPENPADFSPTQGLCSLVDEIAKDITSVDKSYLVLDRWHKEGKRVSEVLLDVIVSACSRMGDVSRAFETFEAYPQLGLQHRTESYNSLMEVCASQKQVEVIMKLLAQMIKLGIKPNVDTYMQIIEGYVMSGDTNGISHALLITRREGYTPTVRVLERAMGCAKQHQDEKTELLVRRELMAAGHFSEVTFKDGRSQWQDRGRGYSGRGRGRASLPGRQIPYARRDDPRFIRGGANQRDADKQPILTYVGSRPPETQLPQTNKTQTMPDQELEPLDTTAAVPDSTVAAASE